MVKSEKEETGEELFGFFFFDISLFTFHFSLIREK